MTPITEKRVVVATFFLPYTVDFELQEKKKRAFTNTPSTISKPSSSPATNTEDTHLVTNLIQSLAKHQQKEELSEKEETLFDFTKPQELIQPRSKQQRQQEIRKLTPLLSVIPSSRRPSIDSAHVFADAPWSAKPCSAGNIGLNNALFSIQERLPNLAWVGTLGMPTDPLSEKTRDEIHATFKEKYNSYPVMTSEAILDGHYNQYCKQVLWPYFHYVVRDDPKNMMSQGGPYNAYKSLNQQFADTIVENYQEGDIKKIPNAIIGFFLHIPFPSSELFRCIPPRKEILEAMLQSDVIGFQTYSFARHFLQTCARILSVETTPSGIQLDSHYCSVGIHPIGIDITSLNKKISDPTVTQWVTKLKEKYPDKKLIVARDKLDYIKGVRQKLLAFEQFLIRHPEWRGEVVLIQIALSTSEHNELRAHISDVVSRVNSKFSNISYQPIVFLHQDISFAQYLALLTCADACLLTPLRDGMNLTSHEYIVCQRETHNPLILSEFTGTYGSFGASVRVNPWDYRQVGDAIHEALSMSSEEKTDRWNELYKCIETNSAQHFASNMITRLSKIY
ncbi:hypothetical protein INT48_006977 [Thamnidium elegans]|uniref:Uncharacterized protein n=1 Tax=Thamnidium elegans TaxID=101142 RepID=A0A8H7SYI9_9FUNG|nr:hypothetical protein INT48_006977 [Thamnidium elegans]